MPITPELLNETVAKMLRGTLERLDARPSQTPHLVAALQRAKALNPREREREDAADALGMPAFPLREGPPPCPFLRPGEAACACPFCQPEPQGEDR